jgi:hypothetical protein
MSIGGAACAVENDIYYFGGGSCVVRQTSVFKFDTVADEWSILAPMPQSCVYTSASLLGGLVYIVGAGDDHHEVLRFDPASGAWSTLAPTLSDKRSGASFVLGGFLYAVGCRGSVERYDVTSDTWTAVADMLGCRFACCTVSIGAAGPAEEQDLFDSLIAKAASKRQ